MHARRTCHGPRAAATCFKRIRVACGTQDGKLERAVEDEAALHVDGCVEAVLALSSTDIATCRHKLMATLLK